MTLRACVINLGVATERMAVMARQLDRLGFAWQRQEALTPDTLHPGPDDRYWQRWQRPLRTTEMALAASHRAAWSEVRDGPVLILEDDALLSPSLLDFYNHIEDMPGISHVSLETRGRKKLLERAPGLAWRMRQDRTGSAAYILWPSGARALMDRMDQVAAPSDALIAETAMDSYQAVPALAVQFDICVAYGINPPLDTVSHIDTVAKPPVPKRAGFRRRRILAQLAMGLNAISHPRAIKLHVQPAPDLAEMAAFLDMRSG
ncbi:MAG: glycosyltransferase family 25 protein [Pseudomonadota bacterium]